MHFRILVSRTENRLTYVLGDNGQAVVIDPVAADTVLITAVLAELGLRLVHVLNTHMHADAQEFGGELARRHGVPCGMGAAYSVPAACSPVRGGMRIAFGFEFVEVLDTPGHTAGCVSYLWRDRLFCGDLLDVAACAAGDSEADAGVLHDSLVHRVFCLPDETLLFPAHPIKGRHVSLIHEERQRHARRGGVSREQLITTVARRQRAS